MVQVSSKTPSLHRSPKFTITLHWFFLAFVFSLFGTAGFYILLSSKGERMHDTMIRASRTSALTIQRSAKPYIIYGTAWKKADTSRLVNDAIRAGFRFVDTACQPRHYNEAGVGEGWTNAAHDLGLDRSDLFLQTKFTSIDGQDPDNVPYDASSDLEEQVRQSVSVSLTNLRTTYLDSLVMHSPMRTHEDIMRVWRVFESFVDGGKVKALGMSNIYDPNRLRRIYDEARIKPSVVQNRFYDKSGFDTELRRFCKDKGMLYQSFWTLTGNRRALASPEIKKMAEAKDLTPSTLMYAFMMTLGHTPLSGTTSRNHMDEDVVVMQRIQGGEEILGEEELKKMASILGVPL